MNKVVPFERGNDYLLRRAQVNRRKGRLLDALALQRRAVEQDGDLASRMDVAQTLCEMGCYEQSNRVLSGMLSQGGVPDDCYFGLCCNYVGMDEIELAYRAMIQFLSRAPQSLGRDEVARMFKNIMTVRTTQEQRGAPRRTVRAEKLVRAAKAHTAEGRLDLSERLLYRALGALAGEGDSVARAALADVLSRQGRHAEACAQAARAISGEEVEDGALHAAACVYAAAGERDKGESAVRRLELRNPQGASHRLLLDACCTLLDDERVRVIAPRVLHDAPYDIRLLHVCAVNRLREGRPVEQAVSFWTRALRIDPADVVARYNLRLAAQGKLDAGMRYTYSLPAQECARYLDALYKAQWLDEAELTERFERGRALEEKCCWGLYAGDRAALVAARALLPRIDCPEARRMLSESLATPGATDGMPSSAWGGDVPKPIVNPDVSTVRVPLRLRRAMKGAARLVQILHSDVSHQIVRKVLQYLTQSGARPLPESIEGLTAALVYMGTRNQKNPFDLDKIADIAQCSARRAARYVRLLGAEEGKKDGDAD